MPDLSALGLALLALGAPLHAGAAVAAAAPHRSGLRARHAPQLRTGPTPDFSAVDAVINDAIAAGVFPGAAASVTDASGNVLMMKGYGSYVYGGGRTVSTTSLFDMASVSKIVGCTTTSAYLVQQGLLDVDWLAVDPRLLGPAFGAQGKGSIRVRDLLMHQAGYPPDPVPGYWEASFGCAQGAPPPLNFDCHERVFTSLLNQTLAYPTGTAWLYSDLSMITMQFILGNVIANNDLVPPGAAFLPGCAPALANPAAHPGLWRTCHYEAYLRSVILPGVGMPATGYLPPPASAPNCLPTWNDTDYRHELVQGQVSDENSYAMGGIAGHAGIFSQVQDMTAFVNMWMGRSAKGFLNESTIELFRVAPTPAFSPRALGWVTQAATDTYLGCGNFSASTYYHTGYTGTLLCADPTTNVTTILLTNRVYPNKTAQMDTIHTTRQDFNNAVLAALGLGSQR